MLLSQPCAKKQGVPRPTARGQQRCACSLWGRPSDAGAGGALLGTLLGAAHYDAASGTVHPLPKLADPRVYTVRVEGDEALFGTEGGLSRVAWAPTVTSMAGVSLPGAEH